MKNKKEAVLKYFLPRIQDVLFISIFASVINIGPRLFNLDGDLGRHITIGKYIIENFKIPTADIFSHTMTSLPLVPHEWLAQLAFGMATNLLGLNGDVLLSGVIIGFTFLLLYKEITRQGTSPIIAAFTVLWAAMTSSIHWLSRPHLFTFLFITLWIIKLNQQATKNKYDIWFFPILMLLWANTHGAFIAGFVVLGAYIAEWAIKYYLGVSNKEEGIKLSIISITSFAVTFINPSGYKLWTTSLGYISNTYLVSHTMEYMPPNFQNLSMLPFLFMLIYCLLSLSSKETINFKEALLITGWAVMALYSMRNIPLFAIVAAPILARLMQKQTNSIQWLKNLGGNIYRIESQLKGSLWPVLVIAAIIFAFNKNIKLDSAHQGNNFDPKVFPIHAMDWLKTHPQNGNMFNYFTWGGYILYETWPQYLVFIDGQTDFYGESLTREYETVITVNDGWENVMTKYDISWAIIQSNSLLAARLIEDQNWKTLYIDETAIILRK